MSADGATPDGSITDHWSSPAFLEEVAAWVASEAARHGIELTGDREQPHCRPWSSAIRFGSDAGHLWFKVNGPGTRHEGSLVAVLSRLEPTLVPPVLAVDAELGWSLSRDAGPVMRSVAGPDELWPHWEALLPRYADGQIRLAEHGAEVLDTGLEEVSPKTLPMHLRDLVDELGAVAPEQGGLTAAERRALDSVTDDYDTWCAELGASGIPGSVQHDDLHSGNVCWGGSAVSARIIDWGDASWGFPLGTMLCTLNSVAWHARTELDDPRVLRVRDAYLEPFTALADHSDLVRHVGTVRRTGCVTRALSYRRALVGEPLAVHAEADFPVRGWLLELLES